MHLAELGMLCAAFKRANPGSVLDLLVDGDNKFNGFTIVPGSRVHVLPAVLNVVCADAYHMKVLIFNNQSAIGSGCVDTATAAMECVCEQAMQACLSVCGRLPLARGKGSRRRN